MKAPAVQWYFGDWLRCAEVRLCGLDARGLWIDMLGFMHQATPYGHLVFEGKPVDARRLANMVGGGATTARVSNLLKELKENGVYSIDDKGVIYCRRMVRDELKRQAWAAEKREQRGDIAPGATNKPPDKLQTKERTSAGQRTDSPPDNGVASGRCPPDLHSAVLPDLQDNPSEKRFPGRDTTGESAGDFGAALKAIQPPGPEADVRNADETPAGLLAAVCQRNGIQANAFHPLVVEWARDGFTVEQLKTAIASAREPQRKGEGRVPLAYLDPILRDLGNTKPRAASWKTDDVAADGLCRELGIKPAKAGETRDAWHQRIETAIAEQSRRRVA